MAKQLPRFTISVDSREKQPYPFPAGMSQSVYLETGDYGIVEAPLLAIIDRKNPDDAVSTVINHRERFEAELVRMQEYKYRAIVIESTIEELLKPYKRSKANPKSVIQSYLSFSVRYNVHVVWAGSRAIGMTVTLRLLEWAWKERCKEQGLV